MEYYDNADESQKPKILEMLNEERTSSAQKIIDLNKEMSIKYKEFEHKIRSEQQ